MLLRHSLEEDNRLASVALTSTQRGEMAKLREELWQSFVKLQRTTDLNLSLFDCLSKLANEVAVLGASVDQIMAEQELLGEAYLELEDTCVLEKDVLDRKLDALAYCLQQLEYEFGGGSKMYEKLMAACSNLEITRPGGASSPECVRACRSCADEYLYMLKTSLAEHLERDSKVSISVIV